MSLSDILASIEGLPHVRFLTQNSVAYPAVSALHLFGIALVFGSIVPVDLRLLRLLGAQFDPVLPTLVRTALIGFAIAATSGLLLASIRILDYAQNPAFLIKMVILLSAGANAFVLRIRSGSRHVENTIGRTACIAAAAMSLGLWTSAVLAGRWIAFV